VRDVGLWILDDGLWIVESRACSGKIPLYPPLIKGEEKGDLKNPSPFPLPTLRRGRVRVRGIQKLKAKG